MKRALLAALACLLALPAGARDVVFPPGAGVGLVPPEGFVPNPGLAGFVRQRDGASIVMMEFPAASCDQVRGALAPEQLARQGIRAEGAREIDVRGRAMPLVVGEQRQAGGTLAKWAMVYCDDLASVVAMAQVAGYPAPAGTAQEIEAALATITVRSVSLEERLSVLPFTFNQLPGRMVVREILPGGIAALTRPDAPRAPGQPLLVIGRTPGPVIGAEHAGTLSERLLKSGTQFIDLEVVSRSQVEMGGGIPAVRTEARGADRASGAPVRLVQWLALSPQGGYLRVVASAQEADYAAVAEDFAAVAQATAFR